MSAATKAKGNTERGRRDGQQTTYGELAQVIDSLPIICRETRRVRRATLRDVAAATGLALTTIMRFEDGIGATVSTLLAVMRWLDDDSGLLGIGGEE